MSSGWQGTAGEKPPSFHQIPSPGEGIQLRTVTLLETIHLETGMSSCVGDMVNQGQLVTFYRADYWIV